MADATLDFFFKFFELWLRGKKNFSKNCKSDFFIFFIAREKLHDDGVIITWCGKNYTIRGELLQVVFKYLFCPYFDFFRFRVV